MSDEESPVSDESKERPAFEVRKPQPPREESPTSMRRDADEPLLPIGERLHTCRECGFYGYRSEHPQSHDLGVEMIRKIGAA